MAADPTPTRLVLRALATTAALVAVGLAALAMTGCGLVPQQTTQQAPAQTYAVTDLDTGTTHDMQVAVQPGPPSQPTPGLRIELTDLAATGSIATAILALAIAWLARRSANGTRRSLEQWRSSPPGQ